jgi:hypothetical protein
MLIALLNTLFKTLPVKIVAGAVRHQNFILDFAHVRINDLIISLVQFFAEEVIPNDVDKILHPVEPKIGNKNPVKD